MAAHVGGGPLLLECTILAEALLYPFLMPLDLAELKGCCWGRWKLLQLLLQLDSIILPTPPCLPVSCSVPTVHSMQLCYRQLLFAIATLRHSLTHTSVTFFGPGCAQAVPRGPGTGGQAVPSSNLAPAAWQHLGPSPKSHTGHPTQPSTAATQDPMRCQHQHGCVRGPERPPQRYTKTNGSRDQGMNNLVTEP